MNKITPFRSDNFERSPNSPHMANQRDTAFGVVSYENLGGKLEDPVARLTMDIYEHQVLDKNQVKTLSLPILLLKVLNKK